MAVRIKRLWNSVLVSNASPGSAIFTATAYTMVTRSTLTNNHTAAVTFDLYIVRSGQAAALDPVERVIKNKSIAVDETEPLEDLEGHVLNPTDMIYIVASVDAVLSSHGSGIEVDP